MLEPSNWILTAFLAIAPFDLRSEVLTAALANDHLLETLSCKVTTISEFNGKVETSHGFMVRRANYLRIVSQTRRGLTDLEIEGGKVRMTGPSGSMIMRKDEKSQTLTSSADWLLICKLRLFGPDGRVVLLPELLRDSASKVDVEKASGDAVVSYSILGRVSCEVTLARGKNWLPVRHVRSTTIDTLGKRINQSATLHVQAFTEIAPGLLFPMKCQEVEVTEGYPNVVHSFSVENISLEISDQSKYPPFRFPPNAEIADYIDRRLYRLADDGSRIPILKNGEPVRLQWVDFEKDEISSPAQLRVNELSAKVPTHFNPLPWIWTAVGLLAFLTTAIAWVWYRRRRSFVS